MIKQKFLQLISVRWWNGSAYYAVSLAEALLRAGQEVIVGGRESSPPLIQAQKRNLPCYGELYLERLSPPAIIHNLRALRRFVHNGEISLVNAHRSEDQFYSVLTLRRGGKNIRPLVRTVSDVRLPRNNPFNRWLHERGVDYYVFTSETLLARYRKLWPFFAEKSVVIHGGVDIDQFRPRPRNEQLRQHWGVRPEEVLIGKIGRLSPVKDHATFLRAAARICKEEQGAKFLISGEEVEIRLDQLRALARDLDLEKRVIFQPKYPDVRELIATVDIGVVASKGSEVVCRIAMEMLAMGKPLVVTNVNVLPELVTHGQNGLVVPAGDPEAMGEALRSLITLPDLRKSMGLSARRTAEQRLSYPVLASLTLDLYRRLIEHPLSWKK